MNYKRNLMFWILEIKIDVTELWRDQEGYFFSLNFHRNQHVHLPVTICSLLEPQQQKVKYKGMARDMGT